MWKDSQGYITFVKIVYTKWSCYPNLDWWIAASAHEFGHALGLGHNRGAPSIMGEAWNVYGINIPLYDDLAALWVLYRRGNFTVPTYISSRSNATFELSGPEEL